MFTASFGAIVSVQHVQNEELEDGQNMNGINEPVKRGIVLSHLRGLQADVIFLHLKNEEYSRYIIQSFQQRPEV